MPRAATERALEALRRALAEGAPLVHLVGPPGIGKTTLVHCLRAQQGPGLELVTVPYAHVPTGAFWLWAGSEVGLESGLDPKRAVRRHAARAHAEGGAVVLVVDDADALPAETLQDLRATLEMEPGLRALLVSEEEALAAPLPETVPVVPLTEAMDEAETRDFVEGRLEAAGAPQEVRQRFDARALAWLHHETGGVPLLVSALAGRMARGEAGPRPGAAGRARRAEAPARRGREAEGEAPEKAAALPPAARRAAVSRSAAAGAAPTFQPPWRPASPAERGRAAVRARRAGRRGWGRRRRAGEGWRTRAVVLAALVGMGAGLLVADLLGPLPSLRDTAAWQRVAARRDGATPPAEARPGEAAAPAGVPEAEETLPAVSAGPGGEGEAAATAGAAPAPDVPEEPTTSPAGPSAAAGTRSGEAGAAAPTEPPPFMEPEQAAPGPPVVAEVPAGEPPAAGTAGAREAPAEPPGAETAGAREELAEPTAAAATASPSEPEPARAPPAVAPPSAEEPASPAPARAQELPDVAAPPPAAAPAAPPAEPGPVGLLSVAADPWADIEVDGVAIGRTPLGDVPLRQGTHRVVARFPDGSVAQRTVELGEEARVVFP